MVVNLRDGTPVLMTMSDGHAGPNKEYGQRTSMNVAWFRFSSNEEWQLAGTRSMHKLMEIAKMSDNRHEFMELLDIY